MSPAELMFNRKIKDKLPSFIQFNEIDDELRDRDKVMKQKGKEYADENRHAKPNEIKEGDSMVSANKLATKFEPTVFKVVKRTGSEIVVLNEATGSTYRRYVAHAKKVDQSQDVPTVPVNSEPDNVASTSGRPQRKRTMPARYEDETAAKK